MLALILVLVFIVVVVTLSVVYKVTHKNKEEQVAEAPTSEVKKKTREDLLAEYEAICKKAGCLVCIHCSKPIIMHVKKQIRKVDLGYVALGCLAAYKKKIVEESKVVKSETKKK